MGVKGLRTKLFTFEPTTGKGGGIYTFYTKADLDAYMASDLFKGENLANEDSESIISEASGTSQVSQAQSGILRSSSGLSGRP